MSVMNAIHELSPESCISVYGVAIAKVCIDDKRPQMLRGNDCLLPAETPGQNEAPVAARADYYVPCRHPMCAIVIGRA
jgi:hypothetical protein